MFKAYVLAGLLFGLIPFSARAEEAFPCHESSTGWCEMRPAPPPQQRPAALRVPLPVQTEGPRYGERDQHDSAHGDRRCQMEGSTYVEQLRGCFLTITDPREIDKRVGVEAAHMDIDPECANRKSGDTYPRKVIDRTGRPALATVTCR